MIEQLDYFKDPNFRFDEELHMYSYVDAEFQYPIQTFESVTGWISRFKEPFKTDFWAWKKAQQRGVSKQVILDEWKATAKLGTDLGSEVHKWIEDYYNGDDPAMPTEDKVLERVDKFLTLYESKLSIFKPVAQELRVFSRTWGIAGTIDAIFELNGKYYIGDWKTNKKFTDDEFSKNDYFKKKMKYPFEDLWDNSLNAYSLQLGMYAAILEVEAGFKISGSFLCWIGPEGEPKLYKTVNVKDRLLSYLAKEKHKN